MPNPFRILSLDGGGAKGFYTLGILDEIEKNAGKPLHACFDLVYGTSTGAIIAALIARGASIEEVLLLYKKHVPDIMIPDGPVERTAALHTLTKEIFGKTKVSDFKTRIGIVATNWKEERPFIFKASPQQAHGSSGSFVPFFGCTVADAVLASCSAAPFFQTVKLKTSKGEVELADGGFCANNPTLYALADATIPLSNEHANVRMISLGVGSYPPPSKLKSVKRGLFGGWSIARHALNTDFLQKILDTNTGSMDQLRSILYKNVPTLRINDGFPEPAMATDLLEHDLRKLERLTHKWRIAYQKHEMEIKRLLTT